MTWSFQLSHFMDASILCNMKKTDTSCFICSAVVLHPTLQLWIYFEVNVGKILRGNPKETIFLQNVTDVLKADLKAAQERIH